MQCLTGMAAIGGVFRDYKGAVLGCYAAPIGSKSVMFYEILAIIVGVDIAWDRGWKTLWIEAVSKIAVDIVLENIQKYRGN